MTDLVSALDLTRAPITARMLREAWALREDVTARDALYVTLARGLDAGLVTTDRRLARAVPRPGRPVNGRRSPRLRGAHRP